MKPGITASLLALFAVSAGAAGAIPGNPQGHAGIAEAEDRFAARGARLTPLVGREAEIALVLGRWEQARTGEGQVVLLSGEPGIGKSRITQVLRERLADEPHLRLRYQCSPYHTNSAFHPIIEQLERASGFARDDSPDAKLDKLENLLGLDTIPCDRLRRCWRR